MRVLAIDTATSSCSVGLVDGGRLVARRTAAGPQAAQQALGLADACLREAGWTIADVERIAVGRGPGSFTGLRIGLATARGLGVGLGVDVIGAGTLDALLLAIPGAIAAVDARRGEVFAAAPGVAARACAPDGLAALAADGGLVVGDGALAWRELLEAAGAVVPDDPELHVPSPAAIAQLAEATPQPSTPLYLRAPDAVPAGGPS